MRRTTSDIDIDPHRWRLLMVVYAIFLAATLAVVVRRADEFSHGGAEDVFESIRLLKADLEHGRVVLGERHLREARREYDEWSNVQGSPSCDLVDCFGIALTHYRATWEHRTHGEKSLSGTTDPDKAIAERAFTQVRRRLVHVPGPAM